MQINWPETIKDSLITALISLILIIPFIGIYTDLNDSSILIPHLERMPLALGTVFLVFLARITLNIIYAGYHKAVLGITLLSFSSLTTILLWREQVESLSPIYYTAILFSVLLFIIALYQRVKRTHHTKFLNTKHIITSQKLSFLSQNKVFFIAFILLAYFPFSDWASRGMISLLIMLLTYIMLGWGLNIIVGLAGLLDLGYVAFFAVGAYSYALLAIHFDLGFWTCLPLAGLFAAFAGFALGFPVLRLRGDYFAIVTLGFGEIIRVVLINWNEFTGGSNGLLGIPRPTFFGLELGRTVAGQASFHDYFDLPYRSIDKMIFLYLIILILVLLTYFFTSKVRKMPVGRAWEALREDSIAAQSVGINLRNTKLTAFTMSAMLGGFAGAFFATKHEFISPESFSFMESAIILAIVVMGGFGSQVGIVIATLILIGIPELIVQLEQYRMLVFGSGMVLIMILKPKGLIEKRIPTIALKDIGSKNKA